MEKNHCSCYSELKSSFPQNLLEPSWHFFFPPTTKTARGGWSVCIWCRGGKAKPHKASHALLLHTQSTEKTIHVQRRGMNKFLNEEIARKKKSKREGDPFCTHAPKASQQHFERRNGERAVEGMGKKTRRDLCCLITPCAKFYWHLQMLQRLLPHRRARLQSGHRLHLEPLRARQRFGEIK